MLVVMDNHMSMKGIAMARRRTPADIDDLTTPEMPPSAPAASEAPVIPLTIQEVMATISTYLLAQYDERPTDQEAVYDLGRMWTDGHLARAWRGLTKMVDEVLNVPPGT